MEQLVQNIFQLCQYYNKYNIDTEQKEEIRKIKKELEELCKTAYNKISIEYTLLLLALMDVYEITRNEEMLQRVLDVVSGSLEKLEVSAESVKLLSYCWYYVEEEECAERARQMLEELKERGEQAEVAEAAKVYEDMVGG